jgi:tetratricopeptide (TPR) repeat protein
MDGRWKLWLAAALLSNAVGCSMFQKSQPGPYGANSSTISALNQPAPTSTASARSTVIQEPPDDPAVQKSGPLSPATLVVFANSWVESSLKNPNQNPAERERLLSQARQFYNEAAQREPTNVEPLLGLARMYAMTGEIEKLNSIEARLKAEHGGKAKVWAWIAVRQGQTKDWDGACENYHKAVKLEPDNRLYRTHLGFTLARAGRYEEGYAWLSRSMKETEARYNLSLMMVHNGQTEPAKQQLHYALQVDPNFKPAIDQLAMISSGGGSLPTTVPLPEESIRTVGFQQQPPPQPAGPVIRSGNGPAPRPMPEPEPLPMGLNGRSNVGPLPGEYTPTTGWDTTAPVR